MSADILFPFYIHRDEERAIVREAEKVKPDGPSRAVLLYGPGGTGKTWLIRELARSRSSEGTAWLETVDVDDPAYWLLSNLERHVADQLDQDGRYFGRYREYISRLPSYTRPRIGHETVVSHLGRVKRVFQDCYKDFVRSTGKTVVISFDTVETVRGTYLLLTLTQWMKALPATLFILSGRPPPDEGGESTDLIKNELQDPYQGMPVATVRLGAFTQATAVRYLDRSSIKPGLEPQERSKLVLLSRGHPLWLAFTISYLREWGMPEEANAPLSAIEAALPYGRPLTPEGDVLYEAFKRRLVAPYREVDFWHESIKRLAVARQSVNQQIWQQLMSDWELPPGVAGWEQAWQELLRTPWIRPRANGKYVTLHDAVAEELGLRIIPLHDQDRNWRVELWRQAAAIYAQLTQGPREELDNQLNELDDLLQDLDRIDRLDEAARSSVDVSVLITKAAALDAQKRELDQLRAVGVFYLLLCDHAGGCRLFVDLMAKAKRRHDVLFQDLLALEMQRFLPGRVQLHTFGDVIGDVVQEFLRWLHDVPELHREVGLSMAEYMINNERPLEAKILLENIRQAGANFDHRYRSAILMGNACMRIPNEVARGESYFRAALAEATELRPPECYKHIAEAQKELGFFYRNDGRWREADNAYREARNAIFDTLAQGGSDEERAELASIQTNWAYVKGLEGLYRDGVNLVESAITMRRKLKKVQGEAQSLSVCGEVYRYERRFERAWNAYEAAEQIFHEQRNWSWLGQVYQEQAICLFQAAQDGVHLTPGRNQADQAKRLITLALDICHDQAVRGYPSALNRAGRIYGRDDPNLGLHYLERGIEWARRLSDGWFWFANLIEHAELSYEVWTRTGLQRYRDAITSRAREIEQVMSQYQFPDLRGRWYLLLGNLGIHAWQETGDTGHLGVALGRYAEGFGLIAMGYTGSSGAAAIPDEFRAFRELLRLLPEDVQKEWIQHFRHEWCTLTSGSDLLLARLEELY